MGPQWGAGIICILPGIGVLPQAQVQTDVTYTLLFFTAGIISLGQLIAQSEISLRLADGVETILPLAPDADARNFVLLVGAAVVVSMTGTNPTVPALLTPLAEQLAQVTGWSIPAVLMTQVVGIGHVVLPYQAPPLMVGIVLGNLNPGKVLRFNLVLVAISALFLLPLDFLWWRLLGWI